MSGHVLLADNDPDFLDTRAEFLEQAGYRVLKAYTLAQARQLLAEAHLHLAILDIRMEKDDDEKDVSGLTLAKDPAFCPVPKIMLTGFPSYQAVREALGPALDGMPPAVDYLSKQEGPEALIQAVERAFAQHVRLNPDLVIRWDEREPLFFPYLVSLIQPETPPEHLPDRVGELEDLFRKLFYDKRQITLGRLLWHREGRACLTAFAYSPEGVAEQRLVTCGMRSQIEQEMARYKEYAPKGGTSTALVSPAKTMNFAALAHDLHEADLEQVQTFEAFYRTNKAAQIRDVVRHLVQTTLAAWHQEGRILEERKSLEQLYRERLGLDQDALPPQRFQEQAQVLVKESLSLGPTQMWLSAEELTLRFPNGQVVSYPNPIPHLYENQNDHPVPCRISPGTLNSSNILVDQKARTWLTDFAQAGPAPLLWDFVSLEAAIRFDLVDTTNLQALHDFETRLVTPDRLNERLDAQDIDPPLRKALEVIQEIRRLAFSAAGGDPIPYNQGLLFHAASEVASYAPDLKHRRGELARLVHALLAAAMICKSIGRMPGKPAQRSSSSSAEGIRIDETNRRVWVGGRQVRLSPSEFDLLLYLYTHAGQLCKRRAIVEEGLRGKYMGDKQEAGRINTMITRLRKKIEPDPDHLCYIITIRGEGYMLCTGGESSS